MDIKQKYTVCYAIYCSTEVLATSADDAVEKVFDRPNQDFLNEIDEVEPTLVIDSNGIQYVH